MEAEEVVQVFERSSAGGGGSGGHQAAAGGASHPPLHAPPADDTNAVMVGVCKVGAVDAPHPACIQCGRPVSQSGRQARAPLPPAPRPAPMAPPQTGVPVTLAPEVRFGICRREGGVLAGCLTERHGMCCPQGGAIPVRSLPSQTATHEPGGATVAADSTRPHLGAVLSLGDQPGTAGTCSNPCRLFW